MDVRLPDGTLLRNVPEGTTKAQLTEKLAANGYDIGKLAPVEATTTRENVLPERAPEWAKKYPKLYEGAVTARQVLGPTIEAGGAVIGTVLGAGAGTVAGPVGTATGGVAGAGLGYGIAKEALEQADVALGLKAPRQGAAIATEPAKNILEGATYEAGGRVVAPVIAKGAGKVAEGVSNVLGKVADLRQIPTQKAAKIAREAVAGGELDQVLNALRNAAPGVTPAQAIADAGLNQPVVQSLLKNVATRDPKFFTDLLQTQDFATVNKLSQLAGGETATAARGSRNVAKEELNKLLIPKLETEIEAANLAGKLKPKLEGEAQRFAEAATSKVQDVRRFEAASDRAAKVATQQAIEKGLPTSAARYSYTGELAEKAKDVAAKAAEASLPFGEAAAFKQAAADSLAAYKLKPLTSQSITNAINQKLADPKIGPNKDVARALAMTRDDMVQWTNADGIIDGWALETIRKNVAGNIQSLMPNADVGAQKRLAAKVMAEVKPLIVDAIETAGGTGYRKYLGDYAEGMQKIGQTKLGAQAMELYKKSPQQFVDLVEGNSDDLVEKIFGVNNFDIAQEMSKEAMKTLKGAAKQVKTSAEMAKQATAGDQALVELMKDHAINLKLPNVFNVVATTTNKTLDIVGKIVTKRTMAQLTEAAKTAKSFDELLNTLPASERNAVLKALKDPSNWQGAKKMGEKFTGAGALGANALARDQENENALAR